MPGLFGTFMHTAINGHAAIVLGGIATSGGLLAGLMGRGWLRKTLDQEPVVFFSGVAAAVGITCARAPPPALRALPRRARALSRPETARALHFPSLARARPLHSLPIVVLPVRRYLGFDTSQYDAFEFMPLSPAQLAAEKLRADAIAAHNDACLRPKLQYAKEETGTMPTLEAADPEEGDEEDEDE